MASSNAATTAAGTSAAALSERGPGFAAASATATRRRRDGHLLMIGSGLLLGTVGIFVEEAAQDAATTAWFRCVFGLLALLAWGAVTGRLREITALRGRALATVAGAGVLMILNWGLFFAAIPLCSIAVSTVVFHLQPFWLLAMASIFLRERVAPLQWAAAAVALVGLALASGLADNAAGWSSGYALGVALSLIGSFVYAGWALLVRVEGERVGSYPLAVGPCAVGTLALAAWPVVHGLPAADAAWGWLAGLGVLHTGLAYVLLYAGMARLETGRVAVLQFVYPGTAVLVDWAVYGRALSPVQLAGVALIGAALWSLRRAERSKRPGAETRPLADSNEEQRP
jgi:drug/metabolite transporter (DMT)-like permease